jgi:hypothetical protein
MITENTPTTELNKPKPISECESRYPQMTGEFKRLQREQYELFCRKSLNYGTGNISLGSTLEFADDIKLSLTGIWFRQQDKINRLKQLVVLGEADTVNESVQDTYSDLSNYSIIAQIVSNGKWGK